MQIEKYCTIIADGLNNNRKVFKCLLSSFLYYKYTNKILKHKNLSNFFTRKKHFFFKKNHPKIRGKEEQKKEEREKAGQRRNRGKERKKKEQKNS